MWRDGSVVGHWSCTNRVRIQVNALVPFGKALIIITKFIGEDLKPSVPWLFTNNNILAFLAVRKNKCDKWLLFSKEGTGAKLVFWKFSPIILTVRGFDL